MPDDSGAGWWPLIGAFGGVPDFSGLTFTINRSQFLVGNIINAVVSFLIGLSASSEWEAALLYRNAQPFGVRDPIFQRDVAFYVFQLPLWRRGLGWLLVVLVLALGLTALVYFLGRVLVLTSRGPVITARARLSFLTLVTSSSPRILT